MPDSCMFDPSGVEKRWINAFLLMFDLSEVFFAKIRDDSCFFSGGAKCVSIYVVYMTT
jgi:hypothetical protein